MKKSLLIILSLLFTLLLVAGCKRHTEEEVTPKDLYYDIERMQIDMRTSILRDFYDPEPFDQLKAQVMEGKINRLECVYKLREILRDYKCVHLSLQPVDSADLFSKIAPFFFYCYGEDYHVNLTLPKYKKYLGWKLVKIGDSSAKDACEKLSVYSVYSYETQSGTKYCLENAISYNDLQIAGLVQKNGKISFTFENQDGKIATVLCKPVISSKKRIWLPTVPEKQNEILKHYEMNIPYQIKTDSDKKTIYMQYNVCRDNVDYSITTWFSQLMSELKSGWYDTVVFDLRYNGGGTVASQITLNHLLYKNKDELEKYNLAIIETGRSYSCACRMLDDFIRNYPNIVIFGEETGQAVFNYTNVSPNNYLKKLNCYFIYPNELDEVPDLYRRAREVTHTDVHCGTFPDVLVHESYEDWFNGEDTIYNVIFDYFNK